MSTRTPAIKDLTLASSQRKRLDVVYRKAEYRILLGEQPEVFRIGEYNPAAEHRLRKRIIIQREWAVLTPCNPRSQEATQETNTFYYHEMRDALEAHNSQWLPATNHDPLGSWPDEPGFIVADADPVWVRELGLRFRQNAYVAAKVGEALRLIWLV